MGNGAGDHQDPDHRGHEGEMGFHQKTQEPLKSLKRVVEFIHSRTANNLGTYVPDTVPDTGAGQVYASESSPQLHCRRLSGQS